MSPKQPSFNKNVQISKTPKVSEEPGAYKNHYPSWQIGKLDLDGEWGINSLKREKLFKFSDDVMNSLDDVHNKLFDALSELDGKEFESIDVFLSELSQKCENNITLTQQRIILKFIHDNIFDGIFWQEIFPKLKDFETKDWHTIERELYGSGERRKTKHHSVSVSRLGIEAQKRLSQLNMEDVEELYSLRLDGKIRIYGFRKFNYFQILWIDLKHKVYPV